MIIEKIRSQKRSAKIGKENNMKDYKMKLERCFKPIDKKEAKDMTGYILGDKYFYR